MSFTLGYNCKLYRLTTGSRATWGAAGADGTSSAAAPANLDEVSNIENLKRPWNPEAIEANVRRLAPFKSYIYGMVEVGCEFNFRHDSTDADYIAFRTAALTRTMIACAVLTGDKATSGTEGIWVDWMVAEFPFEEDLNAIVNVPVKLMPHADSTVAPQWVKVP